MPPRKKSTPKKSAQKKPATRKSAAADPSRGHGDDESTKAGRTRARILEAAAIVLKERGYASARLSDIAEIAEIQSPALYYYFSSREELIEEVVTIGQTRVYEHVSAELSKAADLEPIDRIAVAIRAQLEVTLRDSHHASAAIRTSSQLPPEIRERQLAEQRKYGDLWRALIAEAADAGQINSTLSTSAARMLALGALNWVPEWWDSRQGSLDEVITAAQTVVLSGLRPPATAGS